MHFLKHLDFLDFHARIKRKDASMTYSTGILKLSTDCYMEYFKLVLTANIGCEENRAQPFYVELLEGSDFQGPQEEIPKQGQEFDHFYESLLFSS